jgi:hypothetical protein
MRRRRHPLLRLFFIALFLHSAASMLVAADPTDPVYVRSQPVGATVIVDGEALGRTPVMLHLSRRMAHSVRLEQVGYEVREIMVRPVLQWNALRHMLFGGPAMGTLHTAVDLTTCRSERLRPKAVDVVLKRMPRLIVGLLGS